MLKEHELREVNPGVSIFQNWMTSTCSLGLIEQGYFGGWPSPPETRILPRRSFRTVF
jgi:hypothetical protein